MGINSAFRGLSSSLNIGDRPNFTPIQNNRQNYSSVANYCKLGKSQFEQSEALLLYKGDEVRKDDAYHMRRMITAHAILV